MIINKFSKRAQITIFMLIGIVIILGAIGGIIHLTIDEKDIASVQPVQIQIREEFLPVKNFVEGCIQSISIDAFKKIGQHGGYISTKDPLITEKTFNFNNDPIESDGITITDLEVPYWLYLKSDTDCNDCTIDGNLPTLEHIEKQVERYITTELKECINDFASLRNIGYLFNTGDITTSASINDKDVTVTVLYPIFTELNDEQNFQNVFRTKLDLKFKDMYNIALNIFLYERDGQILEDTLLNLISLYSAVPDPKGIPPISWVDGKSQIVTWNTEDIKKKFQNEILPGNIPLIQVNATKGAKKINSTIESLDNIYKIILWDTNSLKYPTIDVDFIFDPEWNIHLDIWPNDNGVVKPRVEKTEFILDFAPSHQYNYYNAFYDVSFPVLVTLKDSDSLVKETGSGYVFMFALEANVRDNKDFLKWNNGFGTYGPIDTTNEEISMNIPTYQQGDCEEITVRGESVYECPLTGQRFKDRSGELTCKMKCNIQNGTEETQESDITRSLFCGEKHKISGDITVYASDRFGNPLKDVAVSHGCGLYVSCPIGNTDDDGKLIIKLPICVGSGHFTLEKKGFQNTYITNISTRKGTVFTVEGSLKEYLERDIEVYALDVFDLEQLSLKSGADFDKSKRRLSKRLNKNENVVLNIKQVGDPQLELLQKLPYPNLNFDGPGTQTIALLPAEYEINVQMIQNAEFTLTAGDKIEKVLDELDELDLENVDGYDGDIPDVPEIEPVTIDTAPVGGVEFSENTGYWVITDKNLKKTKIKFYVIDFGDPESLEDINKISQLGNLSKVYRNILEPEFVDR